MENKDGKDEMVEHPSHYAGGKYECIEVMKDLLGRKPFTPFQGGTWFCAFKYMWRVGEKKSDSQDTGSLKAKMIQDLEKSRFYRFLEGRTIKRFNKK